MRRRIGLAVVSCVAIGASAALAGEPSVEDRIRALSGDDPAAVAAAAEALGDSGSAAAHAAPILLDLARSHEDTLIGAASVTALDRLAVAALGEWCDLYERMGKELPLRMAWAPVWNEQRMLGAALHPKDLISNIRPRVRGEPTAQRERNLAAARLAGLAVASTSEARAAEGALCYVRAEGHSAVEDRRRVARMALAWCCRRLAREASAPSPPLPLDEQAIERLVALIGRVGPDIRDALARVVQQAGVDDVRVVEAFGVSLARTIGRFPPDLGRSGVLTYLDSIGGSAAPAAGHIAQLLIVWRGQSRPGQGIEDCTALGATVLLGLGRWEEQAGDGEGSPPAWWQVAVRRAREEHALRKEDPARLEIVRARLAEEDRWAWLALHLLRVRPGDPETSKLVATRLSAAVDAALEDGDADLDAGSVTRILRQLAGRPEMREVLLRIVATDLQELKEAAATALLAYDDLDEDTLVLCSKGTRSAVPHYLVRRGASAAKEIRGMAERLPALHEGVAAEGPDEIEWDHAYVTRLYQQREHILRCIAAAGPALADVRPIVEPLADDPDPLVAHLARVALRRIAEE